MKRYVMLALFLLIATLSFAQTPAPQPPPVTPAPPASPAQAAAPTAAPTIASVLERQLSGLEKVFVPLADAMPEDKWNFAPTNGEFKGVMTFSQMVKHVASVQHSSYARILGEKPPADGENGPDALKSKAQIMKYLQDSFAQGHKAIATITDQNALQPLPNPSGRGTPTRLSLALGPVGHSYDHYGQLVEYLRMNGIIPPASRK